MAPRAIGVIPARLGSTRLPRKMLADLNGRPLLWHVWQRVRLARRLSEVVIATDAVEIAEAVRSWGGTAMLTSPECTSGTARVASIAAELACDLILNIQGDEPLIDPSLLDAIVERQSETGCPLVTAAWRITAQAEVMDPNVVKVVRAASGRRQALYFSRSPIPFVRDVPPARWLEQHVFWGHVGVYGYDQAVLAAYAKAAESPLEVAERLEQLRFVDQGFSFEVVDAPARSRSVDTADDLQAVASLLESARARES